MLLPPTPPFLQFLFPLFYFPAEFCQCWQTGRTVQFQSSLVTLPPRNSQDLEKAKGGKNMETLPASRVNGG